MLKTNLKNFYLGDNKKITISNSDNYENCDISFESKNSNFLITCQAEIVNSKPCFTFKSGLVNKQGRFSVFVKYYNTVKDDDAEKERVGMIDVMVEEYDEDKIRLADLQRDLIVITDKMMGRVRSDYASYTIDQKSVVALTPDDLRTASAMIQKEITTLKRKIFGSKSNRMLLQYND